MGQAKQKIVTSRELAESIDRLITTRIAQFSLAAQHSEAVNKAMTDEAEVLIRELADGLKRLDHNGGVYVVGEHK